MQEEMWGHKNRQKNRDKKTAHAHGYPRNKDGADDLQEWIEDEDENHAAEGEDERVSGWNAEQ